MKKIFFILFLMILLAGCTNQKFSYDEKDVPPINNNAVDNDAMARINDIKMGATPKVKPTGNSSTNNSNNQSNMETQTSENKIQLEDLAKDYNSAVIKTTMGDIKVSFYATESPLTVNNFMNLAKKGFYNGTKFHRIIKDFLIQGGDPLSKESDSSKWGTGGPGYKFQDEINAHKLIKGSLAMANSGANTNGSQFFIVTTDATPWLDGKHTNFGEVVEGLDVVEKIGTVQTGASDRPVDDVIVNSIELIK